MSGKGVDKILNSALKELKKELRDKLNRETTVAIFSVDIIHKAYIDQLNFMYAEDRKGQRKVKYPAWIELSEQDKNSISKFIEQEAEKVLKELNKLYKQASNDNSLKGLTVEVEDKSNKSFIVTISRIKTKSGRFAKLGKQIGFRGREIETTSFQSIKNIYRDSLNTLWQKIATKVTNKKDLSEDWLKGAIDLEHSMGESVAQRRISGALNKLLQNVSSTGPAASGLLESLGLEIFIKYVALKSDTNVKVHVGSSSKNRSIAADEKKLIQELESTLNSILKNWSLSKKREVFLEWSGSDSRFTIEKKKIVKSFTSSLKKNKKTKVQSINTDLNLSSKTSNKKIIKGKSSTNKAEINFKPETKKFTIDLNKQPTLNLNALKAQINARLSMQVIKNMGTPALENRTGRFARSAIVTDVVQTSQGFPSIAYTYQKYPYQTFEPGFKQGSTQRDPRTLIDRSIREIATQLIVGRFYTRRV